MKTLIITILSIILLLGVSLTTLHAVNDDSYHAKKAITDVICTCGCGMKAIDCGCVSAFEALKKAGYSMEDIEEYIKGKGVI